MDERNNWKFNIFLSVIRTFLSTKGCAPNYFLQFPLRGSPTVKQYVLNIIHLCNQYGRFIKKIVTPLFMWGCDCKVIIVSFKISHMLCSSSHFFYSLAPKTLQQNRKKIKRERLKCHLYGQLIAILLCSSTLFKMRQLLLMKKKQELSEYKTIYMIKDYFLLLFQAMQKDTQELSKILIRLFNLLQQNVRKSHRYEKKKVFDILGFVYNCTMSNNQAA
ncbi:transposase for insertion sequence element IS231E [Bacillus cereus VD196]|uniref:Transposase for insertion sequence element IS231E n=1 Tax=Bacillus cereus VD196 TaxID=1053243 RepID=A0A9W5PYM4_BACCE|nr:transposase for insertion sequence element IS231E [Bacillus cereus VD196]